MADVDVAQWLEQWVEENLTARRHVERQSEVHDQAKACAEKAQAAGISVAEIGDAADGDLEAYLLQRRNAATDRGAFGADRPAWVADRVASGVGAIVPAGTPIATDLVFRDRTLELEEFVEEMVVLKEARVVEQITLRRAGRDRIETVRDTLRRTEVEIEDARGRGVAVTAVAAVDVIEAGDRERIVGGVEVIAPDRPRDLSR